MASEEDLKHIVDIIKRGEIGELLRRVDPKEIPQVLLRLPAEYRYRGLLLIPDRILKDLLTDIPFEWILELTRLLGEERISKILADLPSDELSDILGKMPPKIRKKLLNQLPPPKFEEVRTLLTYPPDTAGGLMTPRIPKFYEKVQVDEAIKEFSFNVSFGGYDTYHYIYAISKDGKLTGMLSTSELMVAPKDKMLSEVVRPLTQTVNPLVDQEEAARIMARYDLIELPVVDREGRLLGVITIDDAVDVLMKESTEDLAMFGGYLFLKEARASYLGASVKNLVKRRVLWLVMLALFEMITVNVLSGFEAIISSVVALSFFIPLLIDIGGNVGSQSASFIIRSLALKEVVFYDVLRVAAKEACVSLGLGVALSPIIFMVGFIITWRISIALCLSLTVIAIVFVAAMLGSLLPFFFAKMGIDPATVSAPLITTIADITGLTLYFTIAKILLFS